MDLCKFWCSLHCSSWVFVDILLMGELESVTISLLLTAQWLSPEDGQSQASPSQWVTASQGPVKQLLTTLYGFSTSLGSKLVRTAVRSFSDEDEMDCDGNIQLCDLCVNLAVSVNKNIAEHLCQWGSSVIPSHQSKGWGLTTPKSSLWGLILIFSSDMRCRPHSAHCLDNLFI